MSILAPTVHLNGTSKEALIDQIKDAYGAIETAIDALCAAAPNARDYYPQGPDAFSAARAQHDARAKKLVEVRDELTGIYHALDGGWEG